MKQGRDHTAVSRAALFRQGRQRLNEKHFGRGRRGFFRELGRYSAHLNLEVDRRRRGEAVHDFFHRAVAMHARFQDFGVLAYSEAGLTSGCVEVLDAPCFSRVWCASGIGFYEQALVMNHAVPLRIDENKLKGLGISIISIAGAPSVAQAQGVSGAETAVMLAAMTGSDSSCADSASGCD